MFEALTANNPWWNGELRIPEELAPATERPLAKHLWKRLLNPVMRRHLVVMGPRRVGKTTVMYQTAKHLLEKGIPGNRICWVQLDHPALIRSDLGEVVKLLVNTSGATPDQPAYLFLDELIHSDKWDLWLKTFHDGHWPVRITASSSAAAVLRKGGVESGVGRWEEISLGTYMLSEAVQLGGTTLDIPKADGLHEMISALSAMYPSLADQCVESRQRLLYAGGFPEFLLAHDSELGQSGILPMFSPAEINSKFFDFAQRILRNDAVERTIYKDMASYKLDNPMAMEHILCVLADQIAGLLSPQRICSDVGITVQTFERYLGHLVKCYLVFVLHNYARSEEAVQRRGRKIYFVDIAVRNAVLMRKMFALSRDDQGKLWENMAASHLHSLSKEVGVRLYHWRRGTAEVDFVYDDPECPLAFEIGSGAKHTLKGLRAFREEHGRFKEGCYYVAPGIDFAPPKVTGIGRMPLELLLFAIGLLCESQFNLKYARPGVSLSL